MVTETEKDEKPCGSGEAVVRLSILKMGMVESINVKTKVIGEGKDETEQMADRTDGAPVKIDC